MRLVISARYRVAVLLIAMIGTALGILTEYGVWASDSPGSSYRLVAYAAIGLTAAYQLMRHRRFEAVAAMTALAFCTLSLTKAGHLTGFDSGNTLACLILISVVYVATRESRTVAPLVFGATLTATYTVASVMVERPSASEAIAKLLIGIPGQALVMWITWQLIQSLAEASEHQARTARIQQALATCSQALLTGRDKEPLDAALDALLDATEADYAYIDINRVGDEGDITWEIVAEAVGGNVPSGPNAFNEGDYIQFPELMERLSAGRSSRIQVSKLPMPIRARYEAEGIQSELMAPIMIRGQWVGTLGYSDFWRDDAWSKAEVDGLMRAADMVGAYWERESAREGLEELAKAKDRFIATVSHELRTPLAAVVGFAGELSQSLDRYSRDEVLEMVTLISNQSIEVAHLVDDLLTAERAASGNLTVTPTTIDLLEETRSIVGSLGIEVTVEGEPIATWADTLRTRQIVRNLLTNAHRYGGGQIKVEVSMREGMALLAVTDDGHGVTSIDAEHIFDPYYRSKSEHTKPDSVGLGLAVARQLALLMDGDLVYRRRLGWTRFELTLPISPQLVATPVR
ncbi:MAG: sensor histidine kinase [Acidimicrobiia bacterium]